MKLKLVAMAMTTCVLAACGGKGGDAAQEDTAKTLNVYNWSDYIAEDTIPNFEKETGVKVTYDVFDSDEMVETKLLAGSSGYDLVVPSLSFLGRQIQAGVFLPLDKSKIPNLAKVDPEMLKRIALQDPGNQFAVPYLWGTTGIGYNVDKIKEIFGSTDVAGSWDMVFKPENAAKLKDCGITVLDTPSELIPIALNYLGEDPHSFDPAVIDKATNLLKGVRPYIRNFHSSSYINDLANGDICVAVGFSGDILQAESRAKEAKNGVNIGYNIPKEGAAIWFDMVAMPVDAPNEKAGYAFMNYLLRPDVMASITNYVHYANGNAAADSLVDPAIKADTKVYPSPEMMGKLFALQAMPLNIDRVRMRVWITIRTGK